MNLSTLVDAASCERLCLTLLHSLWQAPLLAIVAWCVGRLWRNRSSVERRYVVHVAALLVMLAAMPITHLLIDPVERPVDRPVDATLETPMVATAPVVEPEAIPGARPEETELVASAPMPTQTIDQPFEADDPATVAPATVSPPVAGSPAVESSWRLLAAPWIVALYGVGVVFMLARLALGIVGANRLGAHAELVTQGPLVEALRTLARGWSMRVVPAVARAEQIIVPKVIGLARPTILLPASAISGLSTDELEMILAHELAHVRRHDMWVHLIPITAKSGWISVALPPFRPC